MFPEIDRTISASLLRLRLKSPFFATLSLFTHYQPSLAIDTAGTDGKNIFFNPEYLCTLTTPQQDGLLLHELLHAALLHITRRGMREPKLWNIAADIVVNGLIMEQGNFQLPEDALRKPNWEKFSVEEIYELLMKESKLPNLINPDLLSHPPDILEEPILLRDDYPEGENQQQDENWGNLAQNYQTQLQKHWQTAMEQATQVAKSVGKGKLPKGIERQFQQLSQAQLDWRSYLWRYLVQTPSDFQGFDRRFIGLGLYLDVLVGESVQVYVAVDTSGSVDESELNLFLSEVQGILAAYPHIVCDLYYADAELYGPYSLTRDSHIPKPIGGGGTSFIPFFAKVEATQDRSLEGVCVYLTDGYGSFPSSIPSLPVLWVVTAGGLTLEEFPFGEAVRLLPTC